MKVEQVYNLMNTITKEVIGDSAVVNEDLSNVVALGEEIESAAGVDNYVRSLADHIGRVIFVNRPYSGNAVSVLMDGWEYGSILEKVTCNNLIEAEENEAWELQDGTSYDPNIFAGPDVSAKFFNDRIAYDIHMSITRDQVMSSFSSAEQLNGFLSMIYDNIDKSITVKTDKIIMSTIATAIALTLKADYSEGNYSESSGVKAVNLLKLYNDKFGTQLTKAEAITTPEFIRFASYIMGLYQSRISKISTLFNVGGKPRFTSSDRLHFITLADFANAAKAYLQSDTYNDQFVALPNSEIVPFWQGSGTDYSFSSVSSINVTTPNNDNINVDGILGVMFDRDALGVCNLKREVDTQYNAKARFWNNFYHQFSGHFVDTNENIIVFFIQ